MADQLPQLDMSKSVPLAGAPDTTALPPLDLSKSTPVNGATPINAPAQTAQAASMPANLQAAYARGQHAPVAPTPDDQGYIQNRINEASGQLMGVAKGAAETVHTVGSFLHDHLGIPMPEEVLHPELEGGLEAKGTSEKAGKLGEAVGEFFLGDEAVKGLGLAERLGMTQKVVKIASEHPIIAKALGIGLNAMRTGAVSGTEALAHGATPGAALTTGVTTAAGGAALETAGAGIAALRSPATEVQEGIASITKDAGKATGDIKPTAADPYGFRQTADEQVGRYKVAANKLDELSKDAFSESQQMVEDAKDDFTAAGKKAYRESVDLMNSIIEDHRPALKSIGTDVDSMKADYKAAMANNRIATFLNSTTEETGSKAPEATAKLGPALKEKFLDLVQNQKDLLTRAGWTDEHVNAAMDWARKLASTSTTRKVAGRVVGGIVGGGLAAEAAHRGVTGSW